MPDFGPGPPLPLPPVVTTYATAQAVATALITPGTQFISTAGYWNTGDGGGALYVPTATSGPAPGLLQDGVGNWWIVAPGQPLSVLMFGAVGDGVTDDSAAFQAAMTFVGWGVVYIPAKRVCAVNIIIPGGGVMLDGGSPIDPSPSGAIRGHLIPADITKPVVTYGVDAAYVFGSGLRNITITSTTAAATNGSIGLLLGGGATTGVFNNLTIGTRFTDHALKLLGGAAYPVSWNMFHELILEQAGGASNALLGVYYGATYASANYFSQFKIAVGGGVVTKAVINDSAQLYMTDGYIQTGDNHTGILVQQNYPASFPRIYGTDVTVDGPNPANVFLESTVASDSKNYPVAFIRGTMTFAGQYQNQAGHVQTLVGLASWLYQAAVISLPLLWGKLSFINELTGNNVDLLNVGASDNITIGNATHSGSLSLVTLTGSIYLTPQATSAVELGSGGGSNPFIRSTTDNVTTSGDATHRWKNDYAVNFRPGAGTAIWTSGSGSPNTVVTAPVGSLYTDTAGGAATTLYVKETGAGNTGWVAK